MNLLKETKYILKEHNKTLDDIEWVGGSDFSISKKQFIELADSEYDNGFGGQEVATDLMVVGNGFWLERHQYDGSEWWEYKQVPKRMPEKEVHALTRDQAKGWHAWDNLAELQEDGE